VTATSHALIGATIGLAVQQPLLAIPLAFISHLAADSIPHFDFMVRGQDILKRNDNELFRRLVLIDACGAIIVFSVLAFIVNDHDLWRVWLCSLAAISPDFIWGWRMLGELRTHKVKPMGYFSRLHRWIQWKDSTPLIAVEVVLAVITISLINRLR
jgi:hypothetical protein